MPPNSPNIDWAGIIWKGIFMAIPAFLRIYWPYILLLVVLFGIKNRNLIGTLLRRFKPQADAPAASAVQAAPGVTQHTATQPPPAVCVLCGKPVSLKVKTYCRTHAARFGGRIYCFEHQKLIRSQEA